MSKKLVVVIFGGQSSEHDISCISAMTILENIDRNRFDVLMIGITQKGNWLRVDSEEDLKSGDWREGKVGAALLPDAREKCVLIQESTGYTKVKVDAVFPVLHGLYGEDGTIQGLCELARIPYVGCGVLASALGMDKAYTKLIVKELGVLQADFVLAHRYEIKADARAVAKRIEQNLPYPVFVKPSNAGSSKGVNKAGNRQELIFALEEAAVHDKRILIEETIVGHEVECAVFGGLHGEVKASGVGEIVAGAEFYDFDAKYFSTESKTVINPTLPGNAVEEIPEIAKKIFLALDGFGLSRVDFFVTKKGEIIFNEINTMPGFTGISMYPMLFEASGYPKSELVNDLIELAYLR